MVCTDTTGDTVNIPTAFVSFYGDALDEKTPLLRAMQAHLIGKRAELNSALTAAA